MKRFFAFAAASVFAAFVFFTRGTPTAFAAAYTWDGGGATNNWSDCANWSTNVCPVAVDSLTFDATSTKDSVIDAGWTASSGQATAITMAAGYTGTLSLERSLAMSGTFNIASGTFTANAQTVDFNGAVTISGGIFNASSGSTTMAGSFTHTAGGTFNHSNGSIAVDGSGQVTWNVATTEELYDFTLNNSNSSLAMIVSSGDTLNVNGTATFTDGSVGTGTVATKGATVSIGANFGIASNSNGTLLVNGAGAQAVTMAVAANAGFEPFDQVTLSNASATFGGTGTAGLITLDKVTVTAGTLDLTGYTLTALEAVTVNGGTLTLGTTGTNTFAGTFTVSLGTFNGGSATNDFNGTVTVSGGIFNASSGSTTMAGSFTHTAGGTFNHMNGSIAVDGSAQVTWNVATTEELYDFTLNNSNGSLALIVSSGDTLNVNGTATFTDGGVGTGTVAAKGATVSIGANFGIASNTSGTLLVNGAGAQAVTMAVAANAGFEPFDQVTLSNASATFGGTGTTGALVLDKVTVAGGTWDVTGYTMTANEAVTVSGGTLTLGTAGTAAFTATFSLSAGTFNGGSSTNDFNGTVTISGGTFNATSGSTTMAGSLTHTAGGTFNHSNGSITLDGSGQVTWDVMTTEELYDFTLDNSNSSLSLILGTGDTLNVNGTATFTDGGVGTGTVAAKGATVSIGANFGIASNTSGTLLVNGAGVQAVTIAPQTTNTFEVADQFTVNNALATVSGTGVSGRIGFDKVTVTAGLFDMTGYPPTFNEAVTVNGGTLTLGSDGGTFSGTLTASSGTVNAGSGPVTVASTATVSGGTFNGQTAAIDLNGALTVSAGTFNATTGVMNVAGAFTHTAGGTFSHNNGSVVADGGAVTFDVAGSETFYDLTISKPAAALTVATGDTLVVSHTLALTDGAVATGTVNAKGAVTEATTWDGGSVSTSGTLLIDGTAAETFSIQGGVTSAPIGTITLNNANYTINGTGVGALALRTFNLQAGTFNATGYDVTFSLNVTQTGGTFTAGNGIMSMLGTYALSTGTFTAGSGSLSVTGTVTQSSGTFNAGSAAISVTGVFTLSGGTFNSTTGTLSLTDDFIHTAGGTFNHMNGTVKAIGAADATFDVATSETFYNFEIAKTTGWQTIVASGDTVTVLNATTLTDGRVMTGLLDVRGTISIASTFDFGTGSLQFSGTTDQTLTMPAGLEASWDLATLTVDKATGTFFLGSDLTLDCAGTSCNLVMTQGNVDPGGYALRVNDLTLTSGTFVARAGQVDIDDDLAINGGTFNASTGTTLLGGDFTHTGVGAFAHSNGIFEFDTAQDQTINVNATETFYSVRMNKPGYIETITTGDTIVVTGNLFLTNGRFSTGTIEMQGTATTVASTYDIATAPLVFTGSAAQTFDLTGAEALYDGAITVNKSAETLTMLSGLTMDTGTRTLTLQSGTLDLNGNALAVYNFTQSGGTFNGGAGAVDVDNTFTLSAGTYNATTGTTTFGGPFTHTAGGTFNHMNGTVEFNDGSDETLDVATSETFYNLTMNKPGYIGNIGSGDTFIVLGTLSLTDGRFNLGALEMRGDVTVASTYDVAGSAMTFSGSATQAFTLGVAGSINGDITVNKTGGSVQQSGAFTLDQSNQDLTIAAGTYDLNGSVLTVNGSFGTVVVQSGGVLQLQGGETVTLNGGNPTFQAGSAAKYAGAAGPYTLKNWTYKSVEIAGGASSVFALPGALSLGENLTITSGILSLAGNGLTVTGTFSNEGTLRLQGGESVTLTNDSNSGTVEYVGDGDAAADAYAIKDWPYYHLTVNFADAADSASAAASPLDVNGTFTLSEGTFTAPASLTVAGSFAHAGGTFAHNGGTVTLDGGNQAVSGTTTFNHFTKSVAAAATLTLPASATQTFVGTLTLNGIAGQLLSLRSSSNGVAANIDPQGTRTVSYLNVQDNTNINATSVSCVTGCVEGTNVTNWTFTVAGITVGAISGNTTEAGGTATFTVVLDGAPTADVSIGLSSSDATEGTVSPASLTFTAGNWNVPQTVTVTGVDDSLDDGDVAYAIVTAAATSADGNYNGLNAADVNATNADNDASGFTVGAISGNTTEAGGTATFTVVLTAQPTANVSVGLSSSDTTEGTVSPASLTFTAGNWNVPQTVTVTGQDDGIDDGDVSFSVVTAVASSADGNYNGLNPSDVSVTNVDNDTAGVSTSAMSGHTTEAETTATFTAVLTAQPTADVIIPLSSSDATEGTVSPASLTFTALNWDTPQTVTVTGVNDYLDDGDVAYSIVLGAITSSDTAYSGLNPADVGATNDDNDVTGITVSAISGNTTEAGGTATFTLVLNSQPTASVTIDLSSSDTTEGTVSPASVTFTTGNWNIARTVTVTGVDDALDDGNVAYSIVTAAATSTDATYGGLNAGDVTVSNTDDDTAGVTVGAISGNTTEAGGTATFTLVLDAQPTADVVIGLTSSDLTEGTAAPASVTFTSGNWSTPQTVTVTGVDDALDDGNVGYSIVTGAAMSDDSVYNGMNAADVSVTNADDDVSGFTVGAISGNTTEAGGTATFTVVLTAQPTADVSVGLSSSDTTEGTVSPASVTFTSGNWSTPQTVTVTGVNDFVVDGAVAYSIVTAAATSADPNYDALNPADVSVTNADDDAAGFTVGAISGNTTEAGGTATFTVVLTAQPAADVSVGLSSSDTTEGTVAPSSLTFTALNWDMPQTVTVTGVDDGSVDGDVAYSIVTAAATSADPNYDALNPADVSVTNENDDAVGFTVGAISGNVTEAGGTATFTVVLNSQPTADVMIGLSSSDTTEGTVSPASLTFTSGNWNAPQTVTVTGANDDLDDGNVAFSVLTAAVVSDDLAYSGLDPNDVAVTNADDDASGFTVGAISGNTTEAGGTATFTVVLTARPTANVTLGVTSSDTTEASVSTSALTFTSLNWNAPQTVTVTGIDDSSVDGDVVLTVLLAAADSADPNYNGLNPSDVSVTNEDNDVAGVTVVESAAATSVTEGGATDTYTLVLTAQPTADVTVTVTPNALLAADVASVTFTALTWNVPQTVTVSAVEDDIASGDQDLAITHATASDDANFSGLAVASVTAHRVDDDVTGITVGAISGDTTEVGGTATFTVVLTSQPTADVVVGVTSSDTTEGAVSVAEITFVPGAWDTPQTVTVTGVDDDLVDGSVAFSVVLGAAVSADPNYSGTNPPDVSVTNADDDSAGVLVTSSEGATQVNEAGATDTYTLVLTAQPTASVTVSVAPEAPVGADVASVTFTALNWNVPQTVTVSATDDSVAQGTHVHAIAHATASDDVLFAGLAVSNVSVSVLDDDTAGFTVGAISGNTTEAGSTAAFTLALTSEPTADVVVGVTSSDTTEGTVSPATLTFTALTWNAPQTVTVTGAGDSLDDGDVSYSVLLAAAVSDDAAYDALDPSDVSLANQDDDAAGFTLVESADDTTVTEGGTTDAYTVALTSQPTANVTVYFIGDSDVTTAASQIVFTSENWDTPQAAVVSAVNDSVVEGTEVHSILHVVTSSDAQYGSLTLDGVPVSVLDNDEEGQDDGGDGGGGGGGGGGGTTVVTGPTINISNPVAGRTYALGSLRVSWSWTGSIPAVNVYLSWDNGETWALQRYFVTNTGSTTVTLDRESTTARVRVEGTDFISSILNEYSGTFSVSLAAEETVNELEEPLTEQQVVAEQEAAAEVTARVTALPASFPLHGLVKLADDGNPETQYDTTLYYVGADGYRHAFPNTHVFGSWFCDGIEAMTVLSAELAANVTVVTPEEMAAVPLGPNVTYRPGYKMVKFITDPRVYVVDADGSLRWVISEGDAQVIYGPEWNKMIYDISDVFYRNYRFGAVLTDLSWSATAVRESVRYPSDVMEIPGYFTDLAADTDFCPAQ